MNDIKRPYKLTLEVRPKYFYAHVEAGRTELEIALEYWRAIVGKCREIRARRLLVWHDVPVGLSLTDTFVLADKITAMDIHNIKIAFVDPHIANFETHEFGQMVGTNRGAWARVFTTLIEAENWLLQESGMNG